MLDPFQKLLHPENYKEKIEIKKYYCPDILQKRCRKIQRKFIWRKYQIVVLKHPHEEYYAVLDGHHRFYAYYELGPKELRVAIKSQN